MVNYFCHLMALELVQQILISTRVFYIKQGGWIQQFTK